MEGNLVKYKQIIITHKYTRIYIYVCVCVCVCVSVCVCESVWAYKGKYKPLLNEE